MRRAAADGEHDEKQRTCWAEGEGAVAKARGSGLIAKGLEPVLQRIVLACAVG